MDSPAISGFPESAYFLSEETPLSSRRQRVCPVCCQAKPKPEFEKKSLTFVQCQGCGMVFSQQLPEKVGFSFLDARNALPHSGQSGANHPEPASPGFLTELHMLPRPRQGLLLDVGCAQSGFVQAARLAGFTATGIEPAAPNLHPKTGGPLAQPGDFTSGLFPPDHFDVITMWEILGQVPFPDLFLEEAFRILKPGGIMAVSVPNYESLNIRVLGPKSHFLGCPHINCFSETSLGIFLEVHGFEVKTTQTKGLNLQGMWHDLRSQTESQPPHHPASPASHTQPAVFPFNLFHQGMDRLLGLLGLGERLLMSGTKHKL